ncbi:MAG: extracellular solute-binding protein [Clostridia bacterium]|nr:extracellular solute-binding protein [Clostridia bacterium]
MKKFARLMALVLAVVMIFSLAACGKNDTPGTNSGSATPGVAERNPNFNGAAIKVACWWDPMPVADAQTEEGRLQYYQYDEAKKKYNFTVEEIVVDQRDIRTNFEASLMSGDVWADIIYMRAEQAIKWAQKGNLLDLTDLYPMDSVEYNQSMRDYFTLNGKTYAFTYYEDNAENLICFNKDIFDRAGLAYPYELYNNKQWTWDKFIEYVQKATVRDAATGKIDVYGYYANPSLGSAESFMYTALGRQTIEVNANGDYVSAINDPQALQFMEKVRTLNLMDGVYMPPANVQTWSDAPVKFKSGRIAMYRWSMSGGPGSTKDANFDWGVVPIPTLNAGEEYKFLNTTQNVQVMPAALASNIEYAKDVAYVYHQIYKSPYETEEERKAARVSKFETQLDDKESAKIVMDITDNCPVTLNNSVMIGSDDHWEKIDVPVNKAFSGQDTLARAIASVESAHKAIVDQANEEKNKK